MIPFDILLERLKQYDEVQICELLDISSEELVDGFVTRIRERRSYITKELELLDPDDGLADDFDEDLDNS
jgi:hypothetical protein